MSWYLGNIQHKQRGLCVSNGVDDQMFSTRYNLALKRMIRYHLFYLMDEIHEKKLHLNVEVASKNNQCPLEMAKL